VEGARRLGSARIEARADILLFQYQVHCHIIRHPPVPVDEILEKFLKMHLELDDLRRYGIEGVHALTNLDERRVVIDLRLDPHDHPAMEGRFNFTVAHEIGHIWLRHPSVASLRFTPASADPRLVGSYQELEWQADKFASYLLMPRNLVLGEWREKYGTNEPVGITREMEYSARESGLSREEFVKGFAELHASDLAPVFKVSVDAMRIRLQELGLVPRT
jgi:IrrE N-terminal-like domain